MRKSVLIEKKTQVADLFYILLTHCRYHRKNKDQIKMVAAWKSENSCMQIWKMLHANMKCCMQIWYVACIYENVEFCTKRTTIGGCMNVSRDINLERSSYVSGMRVRQVRTCVDTWSLGRARCASSVNTWFLVLLSGRRWTERKGWQNGNYSCWTAKMAALAAKQ